MWYSTQANDYCGVHTNSGVLNHWFYILTIGKTGTNDIGNSYNVTGINIDKAAKIAYRLESVYLSANSTYANARTYGIQAATDLYGAGSPEVIATTNAFYAVGVGSAYECKLLCFKRK
jgi:Zn-dependent metalloprotease